MKREEATTTIARAAVAAEDATGVPAELIAAIAALESGWLRRAPRNNIGGIKYSPVRHGDKQLLITREWLRPEDTAAWARRWPGREILAEEAGPDARGRRLYRVRDWFAAYPTLEAALEDLADLLRSRRYRGALEAYIDHGDLERLVHSIAEAGYTTAAPEEYAARAMRVLASGLEEAIADARAYDDSVDT